MPLADRRPIAAAEARICELQQQLATREREFATVERQCKYWSSQSLKLKRSNMLLSAALSAKSNTVKKISSHSMWVKETGTLEQMLCRWNVDDLPELIARVLYRIRGSDEKRLIAAFAKLLEKPKKGSYLDEFAQILYEVRDKVTAEHFKQTFTARKAETLRVACRWSWNKVRWVRDTWKWKWDAVNEEGEPVKERIMIAPNSKVPMPEPFPIKEMRVHQEETVAGLNSAHDDGRGAEVTDVDALLLELVRRVEEQKLAGGFATSGDEDDPHWIILTGDGAGLTDDESGVRVCMIPGTTERLNQSTHLVHNAALWRAASQAEAWGTVKLRMALTRPALMRIWQEGQPRNAAGELSGVFVRFALSADKPFMCHVLGRRNFSHDFFSPHCSCQSSKRHLYKFDHDQLTHYQGITLEERCNLGLVTVNEAIYGDDSTDNWTITSKGQVGACAPTPHTRHTHTGATDARS